MTYHVVVEPSGECHRLFYQLSGDANSAKHKVLLTMGLGADSSQWEPQFKFFESMPDVSVCIFDNRGVGLSDPVSGRWTTKAMAKDALSLLNHLGWKSNVHLVGVSMGGMITQELALLDLKRFSSMALICTTSGGFSMLKTYIKSLSSGIRLLATSFLSRDPKVQLQAGMQILFPEEFLNQTNFNEEKGEHETNLEKFKRTFILRGKRSREAGAPATPALTIFKQMFAVTTHCISHADLELMSRHFGHSGLVISGDQDVLMHHSNSEILHKGLKGRYLLFEGAGHGVQEQFANELNKTLLENISARL